MRALHTTGRATRAVALFVGPFIMITMGCMLVTLATLYRLTLAHGT